MMKGLRTIFKNKIRSSAIILVVSILMQLLSSMVAYAAAIECMVPNAFSQGTTSGWRAVRRESCNGYATLDDTVKYSGTSSLKISNPSPSGDGVYMTVKTSTPILKKGKVYHFGAMIKAENASDCKIGTEKSNEPITIVSSTFNWQKFEMVYVPIDDGSLEMIIQSEDATSAVWIDDAFCYEYQDGHYVGENLFSNPGFDAKSNGNSNENNADNISNTGASEQIEELQKLYRKIRESKEFKAEDIRPVMGQFKFIPLYYKSNVVIDGDLSEWDDIVSISMPTNSAQYREYIKGSNKDIEGKLKLAYDEENFYVAVEVKDDINYTIDSSNCWRGDSIQMAIGTEGDYGFEINFTRNSETGAPGIYTKLDDFDSAKINMGTTYQNNTTVYEVVVPWDIRFGSVPDSMLFSIIINDNDGAGRAYCVELAPGIAEGKTNYEFPKVEPIDKDSGWYSWIEGSRNSVSKNTEEYDLYIVNEGETRSFSVKTPSGETEEIQIKKGYGIHRTYSITFDTYGDKEVEAIITCDQIQKRSGIGVSVAPNTDDFKAMLEVTGKQLKEIEELLKKCELFGISPEYEKAQYNILELFNGYMKQDIEDNNLTFLSMMFDRLTDIYNTAKENLTAYLNGEKTPLPVPRYVTGDIETDGCVYIADTDINGVLERRPFFFVGYGHFNYDTDVIVSVGGSTMTVGDHYPRMYVYNDDKTTRVAESANGFSNMYHMCEVADEKGVRIEWLLGAEKMMDRLAAAYPETVDHSTGKMNLFSPRMRKEAQDEIAAVLPLLLKYKSFKSVIIYNEPTFKYNDQCESYQPYWALYLSNLYNGDIDYLNKTYGTNYKEFIDVDRPAEPETTPIYYDWQKFNNDLIAEFAGIITDAIHDIAPQIDVSVKMRPLSGRSDSTSYKFLDYGAGIEQLAKVTDVNGCDAHAYWNQASWNKLEKFEMYDMLRGVRNGPVYNTEDHIINDANTVFGYEQAEHAEGDIWQGAIHGRAVTDIWRWSRSYDPTRTDYGLWLVRPDCVDAVTRTTFDLNRLSYEVAEFANKKPRIAVLYSVTSRVYERAMMDAMYTVYSNLLFNGETVKFVSDTTIDDIYDYDVVYVPYSTHVPKNVVDTISEFANRGKKVVLIGKNCLKFDEHNYLNDEEKVREISEKAQIVDVTDISGAIFEDYSHNNIKQNVRENVKNLGQTVTLVNPSTGEAVDNIEYSFVEYDRKKLVNLINHSDFGNDIEFKIYYNGEEVSKSLDLRTYSSYGSVITARPSIPLLLQLNAGDGETEMPFTDIKNHWGMKNIINLYDKGIVSGFGDGTFRPDEKLTVAEFATMINKVLGFEETEYSADFADVKANDWYSKIIQTALDNGMLKEIANEEYSFANKEITREEMCSMIVSAYEKCYSAEMKTGALKFADADKIGEQFAEYIAKTYYNDIISGYEDNTFAPKNNATRAEAVTVILRLLLLTNRG